MRRVVKQQQRVKTSPVVVARRLEEALRTGKRAPGFDADSAELDTLIGAIQSETDKIDDGLEAAGCWVDLDALERGRGDTFERGQSKVPAAAPADPQPEKEVIDLWLTPQVASAELRALAGRELSMDELYPALPDEDSKSESPAQSPAESFDEFVKQLSDPDTKVAAAKLDTDLSRQGVFSMLHDLASVRIAQEENLGDIKWVQPRNLGDWKLMTLSEVDDAAEEYIDLWEDQRPLRRALGA
ncbi:MAG TPA: hypothetical protein VNC78_09370 [Actinomycetota bacterium]|nr:hypothetical protein [Actinomycetota bacterium]